MKPINRISILLLTASLVSFGISKAQTYNYTSVYKYAGTGVGGYSGDFGIATAARIDHPRGAAFDMNNNMYFADALNHVVRRVDAVTGIITTVAGNGTAGTSGDGGAATSATLRSPKDVAVDKLGNLYILDAGNYRVRVVSGGIISAFAGNGFAYTCCDGAPATSAMMDPVSIALSPSGDLYIAEQTCIRKVSGGIITTVAGTTSSSFGHTGDGGAAVAAEVGIISSGISVDALGNVYFAEDAFNCIRKIDMSSGIISTVAGVPGSATAHAGDGGDAVSASLAHPTDIAFDALGNMYISEFDVWAGLYSYSYIRKVSPAGIISTIAGNGSTAAGTLCTAPISTSVGTPYCLAMDNYGSLYISDASNDRIIMLSEGLQIKDVDLNTLCIPGSSSPSVTPRFSVTMAGGVPPYAYSWTAASGNNATLSSTSSANPTISGISSPYVARFDLTVTDNAGCSNTASRKVKATLNSNATFDLSIRDSYFDMYDEPNSQKVLEPANNMFVKSPDLWNRINPDDIPRELDPCYGTGCNNTMYARVRNVGCLAAPAHKTLSFYWTMAGWPEEWPLSWTTGTVAGSLPMGGHIADIDLPALNPGDNAVFSTPWSAPSPFAYYMALGTGDPTKMGSCFLARIVDGHNMFTTDGMTFNEGPDLLTNVINNNNIATRNSWVTRVNNYGPRRINISVGNASSNAQVASLRFRNLDPSASTLDQFVNITLSLGPVYDLWVNGGSVGTYLSTDPQAKTVTFDGTNEMLLENITFAPGDQFFVEWSFEMLPSVNGTDMRNEELAFEQLYTVQNNTEIYGAVHTLVMYDGQTQGPLPAPNLDVQGQAHIKKEVKVFPNPASSALNFEFPAVSEAAVTIMDLMGRVVTEQQIKNQKTLSLDVRSYTPGMYVYKIQSGANVQTGTVVIGK